MQINLIESFNPITIKYLIQNVSEKTHNEAKKTFQQQKINLCLFGFTRGNINIKIARIIQYNMNVFNVQLIMLKNSGENMLYIYDLIIIPKVYS